MIQFDQSNKLSLQITSKATIRGIDIDVCHPSKMYVTEWRRIIPGIQSEWWYTFEFMICLVSNTAIRRHSLSMRNCTTPTRGVESYTVAAITAPPQYTSAVNKYRFEHSIHIYDNLQTLYYPQCCFLFNVKWEIERKNIEKKFGRKIPVRRMQRSRNWLRIPFSWNLKNISISLYLCLYYWNDSFSFPHTTKGRWENVGKWGKNVE